MQKRQREIYIDFLRIIACFMVIYNHTNERGFYRFAFYEPGSAHWWLYTTLSMICKFAIPLFFMISGVTLLGGKEATIGSSLKRVPKIIADILIVSELYYLIDSIAAGTPFSILGTLKTIYQVHYWHIWYLYLYIAFMITLPVLQRVVRAMDMKLLIYICIIYVFFMCLIPILEILAGNICDFITPDWLMRDIFFYPMLGYLLGKKIDINHFQAKHIGLLWIVNTICYGIAMACQYNHAAANIGNMDESYLKLFLPVHASVLFLSVKYLFVRCQMGELFGKIITEIGKCTFGIYLLHIYFLWKTPALSRVWAIFEGAGIIGNTIGVLLSCVGTFVVTGCVVYILRKIPVVKKLL